MYAFHGLTDIGHRRELNEDTIVAKDGLFLVLDGMGGHCAGEVASQLAADAIDWIIDLTCKDRSYGARPLRRAIQRYVEDPLSEELIRGNLRGGDLEVYVEAGNLAYRVAGESADDLQAGRRLASSV